MVACQQCKKQISSEAKTCPLCGAKQRRTGPVAWIVAALFAVWGVNSVINGYQDRRREQAAADSAQAARLLKQQAEAKTKTDCLARRAQLLDEFQALLRQRKLGAAFSTLNDCAQATGDAQLRDLADKARAADLRDTAEDNKHPATARLVALDMLLRDYPKEADTTTTRLHAKLVKLQETENAAEARRVAAQKRREGVTIGMTKDDVLASSWGRPEKVNKSTYSWGTSEQWVYRSGNYLYFRNGVLESIQH